MDLSIVIVTHNSEDYISACLSSVEKAAHNIEHEVFIIDNKSTDQTKFLVRKFTAPFTLIENSENWGFARAVNLGLQRGSGEFFLIINPDIVIHSASLKPLIEFMKNHPQVGICGCRLLNEDGLLQYSKGSFPTLLSTAYRRVLPRRMRKYHLFGYDKMGACDWVTGAFMCIRHRLVEEVGPFDENYFLYYEDVDYCLQAQKKGWEIYYNPSVSAYHLNPHATSVRTRFIENEIRKSRQFFFRKNSVTCFPRLFIYPTQMLKRRLPSRSSLTKKLLKTLKVAQQRIWG